MWRETQLRPAPWTKAAQIKKHSVADLNNLCKQMLRFKPAETLRSYLAGPEQKFLFTFSDIQRTAYEQSCGTDSQVSVIFRKICFGTRSESGLKPTASFPVWCKLPEDRVCLQENSSKSSSLQIPQRLKLPCIIIQVEP